MPQRFTPFATDSDPLDQTNDRQQNGAPDADARVARNETHGKATEVRHQQCRDGGSYAVKSLVVARQIAGSLQLAMSGAVCRREMPRAVLAHNPPCRVDNAQACAFQ